MGESNTKFRWTSLVAVMMMIAILPFAPAKSTTIRAPYEGPAMLAYGDLGDCVDPVRSRGAVCVDIPPGTNAIDVRVVDVNDLAVGGTYYLHDAAGDMVGAGTYCAAVTLPQSGQGNVLVVRVEGIGGPINCADEGQVAAGPATKGIVAIRLR